MAAGLNPQDVLLPDALAFFNQMEDTDGTQRS